MDASIKDNVVYVNGNKVDMYNYFIKKDANNSKFIKEKKPKFKINLNLK